MSDDLFDARDEALAAEPPEWVDATADPDSTAGTGSTADRTVDMEREEAPVVEPQAEPLPPPSE